MKNIKLCFYSFLASLASVSIAKADWLEGLDVTANFYLPNTTVDNIITSFLSWILSIFTLLAVLSFVISGIIFFTAGADSNNAEKAKSMIKYSIMGIVAGLSGYIVVMFIDNFLTGTY